MSALFVRHSISEYYHVNAKCMQSQALIRSHKRYTLTHAYIIRKSTVISYYYHIIRQTNFWYNKTKKNRSTLLTNPKYCVLNSFSVQCDMLLKPLLLDGPRCTFCHFGIDWINVMLYLNLNGNPINRCLGVKENGLYFWLRTQFFHLYIVLFLRGRVWLVSREYFCITCTYT